MSDKSFRPGAIRSIEVRIVPNRGDVDVADLIVINPQYRILRYKKDAQLEELYDWTAGSYDSEKGIITGTWDGTLTKINSPGHYAMELRATIDTEIPRLMVAIDVEI